MVQCRSLLAALALLGAASRLLAAGTPVVLSDLETSDIAGTGSYELLEGGTTSAVTLVSGGRCSQASNGGASSSFRCLKFTPAAGQTVSARFLSSIGDTWNMATDVGVASFWLHLETPPSSDAVTLAEWNETDASVGGKLLWNSDRTLTVKYGATTFGSTAPIYTGTCSSDDFRTCTSSAQCVSGDSCLSCNGTTGADCGKVYVELIQRNSTSTAGDAVQLDLYLNGEHLVTGTPQTVASGLASISDLVLGSLADTAPTGGAVWWVDSVRMGDGTGSASTDQARLGWGPIHTRYPVAQFDNTTTDNSCDTPAEWSCLNDWDGGADFPSDGITDTARARDKGDRGTFTIAAPTVADTAGVAAVLVGRTSNDTFTFTISLTLAACATSCAFDSDVRISDTADGSTTHALIQAEAFGEGPSGPWDQAQLDALGIRVRYEDESKTSAVQRWGGLAVYIAENLPDVTAPTTLPDRNGDGVTMVCACCNSLCLGTFSVACKTDSSIACSQVDFAEWDDTHDKPIGGCNGDDTVARTCTGHRDAFNGGAGIPCTSTDECTPSSPACPGAGCTCDTGNGVCSQNALIPCAADSDCEGFGTCPAAADAECIPSCPEADGSTDYDQSCTTDADCAATEVCAPVHGSLKCIGACPDAGFASWGAQLCAALGPDVECVVYPQGSERSSGLVENRWPGILLGQHHTGRAVRGDSGRCACAAPGDCATGACVSGKCEDVPCTEAGDCTYPTLDPICVFPACDVVVTSEDINTASARPAPECRGVQSESVLACIDGCQTALPCDDHGDCTSARGPDALCYGDRVATPALGDWCATAALAQGEPVCSARPGMNAGSDLIVPLGQCASDDDCASGICWDAGADPLGIYHTGFCGCLTDADCFDAAAYNCVDADLGTGGTQGVCRLACSVDADCPGAPSGACVSGSCRGACSCPTSKDTCTTDADCPVYTGTRDLGWTYQQHGVCATGRCAHGGTTPCERHDPRAIANTDAANHREAIRAFEKMQADADALGSSGPLLLFTTMPRLGWTGGMCSDRFGSLVAVPFGTWQDKPYLDDTSQLLRNHPTLRVEDLQARYDAETFVLAPCHPDGTHLTPPCAIWWGRTLKNRLDTFGTCGRAGNFGREAQRYCQKPDGGWRRTADACITSSDCATLGDRCLLRSCTSDTDCPVEGDVPAGTDCEVLP